MLIDTHKGLFRYARLQFRVASVPANFQRNMESFLYDVPGVDVYLDNILVSGKTKEEHLHWLDMFFQ